MRLDRGSLIVFSNGVIIVAFRGAARSSPQRCAARNGNALVMDAGPLELTIRDASGGAPTLCRIDPR